MHVLLVLILGLIGVAAQSDSAAPEEQGTAPLGTEMHGMYTAASKPPPKDEVDLLLMCILGLAAVAFQFRRRYRASQVAWQRISTPTDPVALQLGVSTPRSPPPATMQWQQTH
jgi:hypothetical protein